MFTNESGVPLYLAAWLVTDDYDYINDPKYISATSLMKPLKEIILSKRVNQEEKDIRDLVDLIPSSLGNALHTAVESAWLNEKKRNNSLKLLGMEEDVIKNVVVNPTEVKEGQIPVYIEKRGFKDVLGYRIGGKFDCVIQGILHDLKTTSAFSWVYGTRDDDFMLQGSLYRWIHPEIVTEDSIRISFIFTDWMKASSLSNPAYPDSRIKHKDIPLMSIRETELWVKNKIAQIDKLKNAPEEDIPRCTEEEVWLSEPKYRYFSDPTKTSGRATRVFNNSQDAIAHQLDKQKGIILESPREAKKCSKYCPAFSVCTQKDEYNHPE
jgi:hypothetical protein